jgi:hypothetical protein
MDGSLDYNNNQQPSNSLFSTLTSNNGDSTALAIETTTKTPFQIIGIVSSIHFNTTDGYEDTGGHSCYEDHFLIHCNKETIDSTSS